jgi:hypothetical protein
MIDINGSYASESYLLECESPSLVLANWWNLSTNLYAKCVD